MDDISKLAKHLADKLNSKHKKDGKVAYQGEDLSSTDVTEWVSTGSSMLDLAISNRPHGGFPVGRITEIVGWEQSGKSLLAAHAIVSTQKKGGLGVYIDTEHAMSREFFEAIGVDYEQMNYVPQTNLEKAFEYIEDIINIVRSESKDVLITIVLDSIMGSNTKNEKDGGFDKQGWNTDKAIVLGLAMRKITDMIANERICFIATNQLREKLGVMFGDKTTTAGGNAVKFHSSVRIKLTAKSLIKPKDRPEAVVGRKTEAEVFKNRLGPPLRKVTYDIYFNSGIDDWGSWLEVMKANDLVEQNGSWYTYGDIKFQSKDFYNLILNDDQRREEIYNKICEAVIMKYKMNEELGIDDVEESETDFLREET